MEEKIQKQLKRGYILPASILVSALILSGTWLYISRFQNTVYQTKEQVNASADAADSKGNAATLAALQDEVLPAEGVSLPAIWGDLGAQMIKSGVIDVDKFTAIYAQRGGLTPDEKKLLTGQDNGQLKITRDNAGYLLNLLWALGLGNKNQILDKGEMTNPSYGGAGRFASTGGWTLAKGSAMDHYSSHAFIKLTAAQQALVDKVSRGIYRPCCGNSAHFPDCNHGMAMLGLLELMAGQGASENQMYQAALTANSYWFPDTYLTIASYLQNKGISWSSVKPQNVLAANFSSARGYQQIRSQIQPVQGQSSGGCGV